MSHPSPPARPEPGWVADLRTHGLDVHHTSAGHCWLRTRRWAQTRYPTNDVAPLSPAERRELLWGARMPILQFHTLPQAGEAPNAHLYLCEDRGYGLASLSSNNRSKVRRGLKRMQVRITMPAEIAAHGYEAYSDTRSRHGSRHLSAEGFRQHWEGEVETPTREVWAAWAGDEIAAFGQIHLCGAWASITATVSANRHLGDYSNHALFFTMLERLMGSGTIESASYGLSSLREETQRDSLHHFKASIGLSPVPVVRRVTVHPLLRPLATAPARAAVRAVERRRPDAPLPRAARGALDLMAGEGPTLLAEDEQAAPGSGS